MNLTSSRGLRSALYYLFFVPFSALAAVDATNVPMSAVYAPSYCSSIDGVDYSSQQYFTSASDVTGKTGQTLMSQNGGSCCTAAKPWNGTSCATLVCPAGTENVGGTCKATANSCAAIGMMLVGATCQAAVPCSTTPMGTQQFTDAPSSSCFTWSGNTNCTVPYQDLGTQGVSRIASSSNPSVHYTFVGAFGDGSQVTFNAGGIAYVGSWCNYDPTYGCMDTSQDFAPLAGGKFNVNIDNIAKYKITIKSYADIDQYLDININGVTAQNTVGGNDVKYVRQNGTSTSIVLGTSSTNPSATAVLNRRSAPPISSSTAVDITPYFHSGANVVSVKFVDYGAFLGHSCSYGFCVDQWSAGGVFLQIKPTPNCY